MAIHEENMARLVTMELASDELWVKIIRRRRELAAKGISLPNLPYPIPAPKYLAARQSTNVACRDPINAPVDARTHEERVHQPDPSPEIQVQREPATMGA